MNHHKLHLEGSDKRLSPLEIDAIFKKYHKLQLEDWDWQCWQGLLDHSARGQQLVDLQSAKKRVP